MAGSQGVGYFAVTSIDHSTRPYFRLRCAVVPVCLSLIVLVQGVCIQAGASQSNNPALVIPRTFMEGCDGRAGTCPLRIPATIRRRSVRFPQLTARTPCPTSRGTYVNVPGANGVALEGNVVSLLIPQAGDVVHGSVQLAPSDVAGWYGIKTHWLIKPSYSGWVVVRAEQLDSAAPVAALGDAGIGPVIIPPGPTPNTFRGWRQQPSGTYVKGPGCFGFQIDGSTFQEHLILRAEFAPGA